MALSGLSALAGLSAFVGASAAPLTLPTPPFTADNLLAWYAYDQSSWNVTDTTDGVTSLSFLKDLTGNGYDFFQENKLLQPDWDAANGPKFTGTQVMTGMDVTGFFNNVAQFYYAALIKLDSASYGALAGQRWAFIASKNSSSNSGRAKFHFNGGATQRKIRYTGSINDGTEVATAVGTTSTPNDAFAVLTTAVDYSTGGVIHRVNGTQNYSGTDLWSGTTGSTPANNPAALWLGNNSLGTEALYGYIREIIILSAAPVTGQQASIESYLTGRAA